MANGECGNKTVITTFLLLEFGTIPEIQSFLLLFLVIYIVTVICNIFIFVLVVVDRHLHKPMYFFLGNSCLETCYSSTILPRMLSSFLTGDKSISIGGCITRFYFFGSLAVTESFLLSVMSYDRYLAVCKPLHYRAVMNSRCCLQLVAWSWVNAFLVMAINVFLISQHAFCGPKFIDKFFCDFTPVIKFSCCDTSLTRNFGVHPLISMCATPFATNPGGLHVYHHHCPENVFHTGMQKAFSTCFSHLIVITTFYGSLIIAYILPKTKTLKALKKFFSVFYTVVTLLLNPLIYSLRNREVKDALSKVINKC